MKKFIFLILLFSSSLYSQSPEYIAKMVEFFKVSGTYETIESSIYYIVEDYKGVYNDVPNEFWLKHIEENKDLYFKNFAEKLAPVYSKYLTLEDIDFVIKFYQTETGKKFASLSSKLMEESSKAGEEWGTFITETIMNDLQEDGYLEE